MKKPKIETGADVLKLRLSLGMSQPRFAEAIHYSEMHVSKVERGCLPLSTKFVMACQLLAMTQPKKRRKKS